MPGEHTDSEMGSQGQWGTGKKSPMSKTKEKFGERNRGSVMSPTDLAPSPDSHFQPNPSLPTLVNLGFYYHPMNRAGLLLKG